MKPARASGRHCQINPPGERGHRRPKARRHPPTNRGPNGHADPPAEPPARASGTPTPGADSASGRRGASSAIRVDASRAGGTRPRGHRRPKRCRHRNFGRTRGAVGPNGFVPETFQSRSEPRPLGPQTSVNAFTTHRMMRLPQARYGPIWRLSLPVTRRTDPCLPSRSRFTRSFSSLSGSSCSASWPAIPAAPRAEKTWRNDLQVFEMG